MSAQPIKPDDLTPDERDAVREIGKPVMQRVLPRAMMDRLIELGLAEQKLGGFALTQDGLFIRHLIS